jgi:hypothetical protein
MPSAHWWLVLCGEHGLVEHPIGTELAAHRAADRHERPGCELRVLTEDQWSELKKAGKLARSSESSSAIKAP